MHTRSLQDGVWCGIDVSATELAVAVLADDFIQQRTFDNRASGHRALIAWLQRQARTAWVCLEATGMYGLDLALALHAAEDCQKSHRRVTCVTAKGALSEQDSHPVMKTSEA